MKQLAIVPAGDRLPELRDAVTLDVPLARARTVKGDVQKVRWLGYASGKSHGFLVPAGPLESATGTLKAVCGKSLDIARLAGDDQRCKSCVTALTEDTRKRGTGLSEGQVEHVATGAQDGAPREAEMRRTAEVALISGDAAKNNAAIVEALRAGDRAGAMEGARKLDARGPAAPVPSAQRAPVGSRDHGMLDGVAMVQGANMDPVQPMWRNPATGESEPAAAFLGGTLNERADREASTVAVVGGTYGYLTRDEVDALSRSQRRKYWAKIKVMADHGARVRADNRAKGVSRIAPTGTGGLGGKSFAEGRSARTERLMQQAPRG